MQFFYVKIFDFKGNFIPEEVLKKAEIILYFILQKIFNESKSDDIVSDIF